MRTASLGLLAVCVWLVSCAPVSAVMKPVVAVVSPADGAQFTPGERVAVRVAAAATHGVARIELRQGDALIGVLDNPSPARTFSAPFEYVTGQTGSVVLLATAVDAAGVSSDPAPLTIQVVDRISLLPTLTPPPGETITTSGPCRENAEFVTDVTIPDNTVVSAGAPFVKTWRLRNAGTCAWGEGYELVFIQGDTLNAPATVPVAPSAPGFETDVSVSFVAPKESGTFTSTWQLRTPQGILFGKRIFTVIRIP